MAVFLGIWFGSIALFPQGLVPLGIKLSGGDDPVWFLALYLPDAWQWPTIAAMVAFGLATYGLVARTYLRHKGRLRRLREEKERPSEIEKQPESEYGSRA